MPRAGEGGDEAVGQEGGGEGKCGRGGGGALGIVTREALTGVDAEKRVEEVALHSAAR